MIVPIPPGGIYNLRSGLNDAGEAIQIPMTYMVILENMFVNRDSLIGRKGRSRRWAAALESGAPIQHVHQHFTRTEVPYLIVACNGKLFRDDMAGGAPTDITNSIGFSTNQDARWQMVDYEYPPASGATQPERGIWGTDGTISFVIPNATSDAVTLRSVTESGPTPAATVALFNDHLFWGNFTDLDGIVRQGSTIYSDPGQPLLYNATSGARNSYDRRRKVTSLIEHDDDALLVMLSRGIHFVNLAPVVEVGRARTNFSYAPLSKTEGLIGKNAWVSTPKGTFFFGRRGLYHIGPGNPPAKPIYVGKPVEKFWKSVLESDRAQFIVGAHLPETSTVTFFVPYGAGQSNNNRALFFNYESWTQWGQDLNDLHPAFSVYLGHTAAAPFAFNCAAYIEDTDGLDAIVAGGYDGHLYTLDRTFLDVNEAIRMRCRTPLLGTPGRENHWMKLVAHITLDAVKNITVTQRNYDDPEEYSSLLTADPEGFILDTDLLDTGVLGTDQEVGPVELEMNSGPSPFCDITLECTPTNGFEVHGMDILAEPGMPVI